MEPHYSAQLFWKPHAPNVRFPVAANVNMIPVLAADLIWTSSAPCPPWVFMPASAVYSVPPSLKDNVINTKRPPIRHHPISDPPPPYTLAAVDPNTPAIRNHIVNGTRSTGNAVASIRGAVDGPVVLYDPVESSNVGPPNILAVHRGCQYPPLPTAPDITIEPTYIHYPYSARKAPSHHSRTSWKRNSANFVSRAASGSAYPKLAITSCRDTLFVPSAAWRGWPPHSVPCPIRELAARRCGHLRLLATA